MTPFFVFSESTTCLFCQVNAYCIAYNGSPIVYRLAVTNGQEVRANIQVFLGDVIDENRFHNCVRESEQALLVLVSTEGAVENDEVTYAGGLPERILSFH